MVPKLAIWKELEWVLFELSRVSLASVAVCASHVSHPSREVKAISREEAFRFAKQATKAYFTFDGSDDQELMFELNMETQRFEALFESWMEIIYHEKSVRNYTWHEPMWLHG